MIISSSMMKGRLIRSLLDNRDRRNEEIFSFATLAILFRLQCGFNQLRLLLLSRLGCSDQGSLYFLIKGKYRVFSIIVNSQ